MNVLRQNTETLRSCRKIFVIAGMIAEEEGLYGISAGVAKVKNEFIKRNIDQKVIKNVLTATQ